MQIHLDSEQATRDRWGEKSPVRLYWNIMCAAIQQHGCLRPHSSIPHQIGQPLLPRRSIKV
jgi:hypothetical protein